MCLIHKGHKYLVFLLWNGTYCPAYMFNILYHFKAYEKKYSILLDIFPEKQVPLYPVEFWPNLHVIQNKVEDFSKSKLQILGSMLNHLYKIFGVHSTCQSGRGPY